MGEGNPGLNSKLFWAQAGQFIPWFPVPGFFSMGTLGPYQTIVYAREEDAAF